MSENENAKSSFEPLFKKSFSLINLYNTHPEAREAIKAIHQLEEYLNQAKHLLKNGKLSLTYQKKLTESIVVKTEELNLLKARFEHKKEELLRDGAYCVESLSLN